MKRNGPSRKASRLILKMPCTTYGEEPGGYLCCPVGAQVLRNFQLNVFAPSHDPPSPRISGPSPPQPLAFCPMPLFSRCLIFILLKLEGK